MIKDRLTEKRRFNFWRPDEETIVAQIKNDQDAFHIADPEDALNQRFISGVAVARLYEYEELGYTPEELSHMIKMYHVYKSQSYSTYGSLGSVKPDQRLAFYQDIHDIIDVAMKKRDRSVSLFFGSQGISVDVIPYPPIEEETE